MIQMRILFEPLFLIDNTSILRKNTEPNIIFVDSTTQDNPRTRNQDTYLRESISKSQNTHKQQQNTHKQQQNTHTDFWNHENSAKIHKKLNPKQR
jgi:hypothetical protein